MSARFHRNRRNLPFRAKAAGQRVTFPTLDLLDMESQPENFVFRFDPLGFSVPPGCRVVLDIITTDPNTYLRGIPTSLPSGLWQMLRADIDGLPFNSVILGASAWVEIVATGERLQLVNPQPILTTNRPPVSAPPGYPTEFQAAVDNDVAIMSVVFWTTTGPGGILILPDPTTLQDGLIQTVFMDPASTDNGTVNDPFMGVINGLSPGALKTYTTNTGVWIALWG